MIQQSNGAKGEFPLVRHVRQSFDDPVVKDIEGEYGGRCSLRKVGSRVKAGGRVAVAVGSRGIANLQSIGAGSGGVL